MKPPILIGVLVFSASPTIAQDIVFLAWPLTAYTSLVAPKTSKVVGSHKEDDRKIFTINMKNKNLSGDGDAPQPVEIYKGQLLFRDRLDGGEFNMSIKRNPPGELLATSKSISLKNGTKYDLVALIKGSCKRINR